MTEEELLLNEDFAAIMRSVSNTAQKVKSKADKVLLGLNYERKETQKMLETFFNALKDKLKGADTVTDEMVKDALFQLRQVGKFAAIAPLFMMPGGGTTTAVLYTIGKKWFNISILPRGLEQVFECVMIQEKRLMTFKEFVEKNK